MKKELCILALLGFASIALAQDAPQQREPQQSTMPSTQQQPSTTDQSKAATANTADVQSDIQAALQKEPTLANSNVNVQVSGKSVELTGTVPSKEAKETAGQIAKSHAGGMSVKNHLKVSGGSAGQSPR